MLGSYLLMYLPIIAVRYGVGAPFNQRAMFEAFPPLPLNAVYAELFPVTPVFCGYLPRRSDARDGAHSGCVVRYRVAVAPRSSIAARIRALAACSSTFASASSTMISTMFDGAIP